ncbi:serine hydrolase domain-containing protein, partial [Parvibaculum sp.]|uniref:serine hydrolase domain-containing protein n=1 Tax=Parvibaculum sp. TaxID=2024848 RepID=UPI002C48DB23
MKQHFILLLAVIVAAVFLAPPPFARAADDPRAAGGMLAWPHEEMVRALGIFIPERMKALDVAGVSVAVVADGGIAYAATFGKADRKTGEPVMPQTLFEAGELGETVAAYGALTMARDKLLFLDAPLSRDLPAPWLSRKSDDGRVTLRQVLTHTSGLPDNVAHPSRRSSFTPGDHFSHSGVGFLYLQHVMATIGKKPFEAEMESRVFAPLGMKSSGYGTAGVGNMARGYVPLSFAVAVFYIPFAATFLVTLVIVWLIMRFTMQRSRLETSDLVWPAAVGVVFAVSAVWYGLGFASAAFIIAVSVGYALAIGLVAGFIFYLFYVVGIVRSRDGVIARGNSRSEGVALAFSFLTAFVVSLIFFEWPLGVPRFPLLEDETPNAARVFHTDAEDMARFMIELLEGREIGTPLLRRMTAERVRLDPPFAWGLGIGIRDDQAGETFWARGS